MGLPAELSFQGHNQVFSSVSIRYLLIGNSNWSVFGGLEVACWLLVPKFAGSNTAEAVGFLRVNKIPQHVGGH